MARGHLCLLLHAHLPYVRHPEHPEFLEEKWFFEAVVECYLPLLAVLHRLRRDGIPFQIVVSLSPTLMAMMDDSLLRDRCAAYLANRLARADTLPAWLGDGLRESCDAYSACRGDLVAAFSGFAHSGHVELITTAATHGFLPLMKNRPESVSAQIGTAADEQRRRFGSNSQGFWLPECGYYPGLEGVLARHGYRYFVLDAHGLPTGRTDRPAQIGPVAAFARDPEISRLVWGPAGYPGNAVYRDFHAMDPAGFKLQAVTGPGPKRAYDPAAATAMVRRHAREFVESCISRLRSIPDDGDGPRVLVGAFDAELFGHWWHEGPAFLEEVLRACTTSQDAMPARGLADYLTQHPPRTSASPGACSWGQHGFNDYWLNAANRWIYPEIRQAEARLLSVLRRSRHPFGDRLLRQALRSLLLAQASDWPFLMTKGTSSAYAAQRVRDQLARVHYLCGLAALAAGKGEAGEHDVAWPPDAVQKVRALEFLDCIFPSLDCRHYLDSTSCAS